MAFLVKLQCGLCLATNTRSLVNALNVTASWGLIATNIKVKYLFVVKVKVVATNDRLHFN